MGLRRLAGNLALVVVSLAVGLVLAEVTLRVAYPRYRHAADTQYDRDDLVVWSPRPNRSTQYPHPDTGLKHWVVHNAMALPQSRNFDDLEAATNVAFFGDSYTANLGLPSQYSFTEPLDYLLNLNGAPVNVLNFGVNGYGTDQSYLHYMSFDRPETLHHVFYIFCANDLRNIFESHLYGLTSEGALKRNSVPAPPWWLRFVSRLHLTYFALDIRQRVLYSRTGNLDTYRTMMEQAGAREAQRDRIGSPRAVELEENFLANVHTSDVRDVVRIFTLLIQEWQDAVDANGGGFSVVLLPTGREDLIRHFIPEGVRVISLYDLFSASIPGYRWSDIQFRNDGHWAEEGNRLAAIHLYHYLESELARQPMDSETVDRELVNYYAAFPDGWMPETAAGAFIGRSAARQRAIRRKYIALESNAETSADGPP